MMGPLGTGFAETGFGCSLLEGLFEGEDERGENANERAAWGLLIANESH
jgi:hypothetical protein